MVSSFEIFSTNSFAFIIPPTRTTCSAHLILLHTITLNIVCLSTHVNVHRILNLVHLPCNWYTQTSSSTKNCSNSWIQNNSYMFRLLSIAIFREYQYENTYTALLQSLSIVNGNLHDNTVLKCKQVRHQQIALVFEYKALLHVSATVRNHLQGVSVLWYIVFLYSLSVVNGKMLICH